eukprot:357778-Chlamydomonas_euryale.AAC.3
MRPHEPRQPRGTARARAAAAAAYFQQLQPAAARQDDFLRRPAAEAPHRGDALRRKGPPDCHGLKAPSSCTPMLLLLLLLRLRRSLRLHRDRSVASLRRRGEALGPPQHRRRHRAPMEERRVARQIYWNGGGRARSEKRQRQAAWSRSPWVTKRVYFPHLPTCDLAASVAALGDRQCVGDALSLGMRASSLATTAHAGNGVSRIPRAELAAC